MPEQNTSSTTPSGRAVSALNHLTHGGTSQTLFLKDEDPDELFALLEDAFKYHSAHEFAGFWPCDRYRPRALVRLAPPENVHR